VLSECDTKNRKMMILAVYLQCFQVRSRWFEILETFFTAFRKVYGFIGLIHSFQNELKRFYLLKKKFVVNVLRLRKLLNEKKEKINAFLLHALADISKMCCILETFATVYLSHINRFS
jgi:hypothetical protein